ncbi:motility associated factor glycosyltransferase family protein [Paenibacillus illinoisensis]|uniref:motility associated factor glycosyltransferase family protein n=1 Tax=Paenibacillus illinoisensis TaxID=59845 RepID=UPI003017920A
MDNYTNNMKLIEDRFNGFFSNELPENLLDDVEIERTIIRERIEYDTQWMQAVELSVQNIDIIFVYGFGQGIGIADLFEKYPDRLFVIYEPNNTSFQYALKQYDLSPILEWPRLLWLSVGENQLNLLFSKLSTHIQEELAFVPLRHFLEHDIEEMNLIREKFMKHYVAFVSNHNTREHFKKLWFENTLYNISEFSKYPEIYELENRFKNETAVIVASGPSLQEDVEWLKKIKNHAIIIASGSSIQFFQKNNFKPHLVTLLDGGEINDQIFSSDIANQTPLMVASRGYHGVVNKKKKNVVYSLLNQDSITQYVLGLDTKRKYIRSSYTVVGTAIQTAIILGAKRIVMFGQDLSYHNGSYYAQGVNHSAGEEISSDNLEKKLKVKNVKGGYNETTLSLMLMKDNIEKLIESNPDVEFINTTAYGAEIIGTTWTSAKKMYESLKSERSVPESLIEDCLDQLDGSPLIELPKFEAKLKFLIDVLVGAKEEATQIKKLLSKGRDQARIKPMKAWDLLAKAEEKWSVLTNQEWFNVIFEAVIPVAMLEFDRILPVIVNEQDVRKKSDLMHQHLGALLTAMVDSIPESIEILREANNRSQTVREGNIRGSVSS